MAKHGAAFPPSHSCLLHGFHHNQNQEFSDLAGRDSKGYYSSRVSCSLISNLVAFT